MVPVCAVSLHDGRNLWEVDASDLPKSPLWMACSADQARLAVVGEESVRIYDMADGKPRGKRSIPVPTVTGIGFVADGTLVIPGRLVEVGQAPGGSLC